MFNRRFTQKYLQSRGHRYRFTIFLKSLEVKLNRLMDKFFYFFFRLANCNAPG